MSKTIALATGTLAGGFCRYWLGGAVYGALGFRFPYGTLAVNLIGCLAVGIINGLAEAKLSLETRLLLMTGFCGSFTTLSSFMLETSSLLRAGESTRAILYVTLSIAGGFLLFRLGEWLSAMVG